MAMAMANWHSDELLKMLERITINYKNSILIIACLLFVLISAIRDWQIAAIVAFISLFAIISFEILKRVVIELGLKKLWGVEFDRDFRGETEVKEAIKTELNEKIKNVTCFNTQTINDIVDKSIDNATNGYAYHTYIGKILNILGVKFTSEKEYSDQNSFARFDFIVKMEDDTDLIIEAKFCNRRRIPFSTINNLCKLAKLAKAYSAKTRFLIITNAKISEEQVKELKLAFESTDVMDDTGLQSQIYDNLRLYFINKPPKYNS